MRGYLQRRTAYHCYPPPASQLRQFCFTVWRGVSRLEGLCTRDWVAKWGVILVGDQDLRARKGLETKRGVVQEVSWEAAETEVLHECMRTRARVRIGTRRNVVWEFASTG